MGINPWTHGGDNRRTSTAGFVMPTNGEIVFAVRPLTFASAALLQGSRSSKLKFRCGAQGGAPEAGKWHPPGARQGFSSIPAQFYPPDTYQNASQHERRAVVPEEHYHSPHNGHYAAVPADAQPIYPPLPMMGHMPMMEHDIVSLGNVEIYPAHQGIAGAGVQHQHHIEYADYPPTQYNHHTPVQQQQYSEYHYPPTYH